MIQKFYSWVCGSDGKEAVCSAPEFDLWVRNPGESNGYPLQYSCLETSMDWAAWWAMLHGVRKNQTWLSDFHFHFIYTYEKNSSKRHMHFNVYISVIYSWKHMELPNLSIKQWMDKENVVYVYIYIERALYIIHIHTCTMEYYRAIKKNKILPFAKVWLNWKCIMLSEISQRQYCMITYMQNLKIKTD